VCAKVSSTGRKSARTSHVRQSQGWIREDARHFIRIVHAEPVTAIRNAAPLGVKMSETGPVRPFCSPLSYHLLREAFEGISQNFSGQLPALLLFVG